jgi:hypothetical protein
VIVADLLAMTTSLDNEIDAGAGGADEARMITSLNMATDYFESVAASLPKVLSSRGVNNIQTAALVESSPFPRELLRLDKLWMLDPNNVPIFPMMRIDEVGGHMPALPWPLNYILNPAPGQPRGYYPDSNTLFWLPVPNQVYQIRAYGLWSVDQYVDRNSAFELPDSCALPIAAFATKYGELALGDATDDVQKVAVEVFTPTLRALRRRDRSRPTGRSYANFHTT